MPTPYDVVDEMLKIANIEESDILYDLGCGDGRIVIKAASQFGIRGVGVDIDPERITECKSNLAASKVENMVKFLNQDLFETDLREASIVTLYLLPTINLKLRPKLFRELKPGTRVISHDFSMGEWDADKTSDMPDDYKMHYIYFWIIPANVTGNWKLALPLELGVQSAALQIEQKFQNIQAHMKIKNTIIPIKNARLRGDMIEFTFEQNKKKGNQTWLFEGRIMEHNMEGEVLFSSGNGRNTRAWKAEREPKTKTPIDVGSPSEWAPISKF